MIFCNSCHKTSSDAIEIGQENTIYVCSKCGSDDYTELNDEENEAIHENELLGSTDVLVFKP